MCIKSYDMNIKNEDDNSKSRIYQTDILKKYAIKAVVLKLKKNPPHS